MKKKEKTLFELNQLAEFIAEYNQDGKYNRTAWNFWRWLKRKYEPKKLEED